VTSTQRLWSFLVFTIAISALVVGTGGPCQYLPPTIKYRGDFRTAEQDIEKLEEIRQKTGTYPEHFGVSSGRLEYSATASGFKLLLEEGMDTWFVYDSATRQWTENGSFGRKSDSRDGP
jgi:hypothetical protein